MFKKLAAIAAFALLSAPGAKAQVVNCTFSFNGICTTTGVLDADGFTVVFNGLIGGAFYAIQTMPFTPGVSNDTKIVAPNGALLADDELNRGYDRFICGTNIAVCPNSVKILPFSAPTNLPVRVFVHQLNN